MTGLYAQCRKAGLTGPVGVSTLTTARSFRAPADVKAYFASLGRASYGSGALACMPPQSPCPGRHRTLVRNAAEP
ncbi:MAG: hypothetical protein LBK69_02205 [Syntrophomonadaceae bacterium]|nr:hypothetical protein [Syntrophomonadaceae bacterium]